MSDYIQEPINVTEFDPKFRKRRGLGDDVQLVEFRQAQFRWTASYQDDEIRMDFEGLMSKAREWLKEE